MAAIASVESGFNPYAIRMNSSARGSTGLSRQPTTKQEAVAKANALSLAGHDLDLGLMGLPAASFAAYGITIEQAFDVCTSLRVASTRLKMLTKAAEMRGLPRAKADQDALAAYFGNGDAELAHLTHPLDRNGWLAALVDALAFAASMPACCRSRMNLRSISATMPSTVTRIGPAASFVENVGSRTVRASRSWTRFSTSRVDRPKWSSLTTTSSSPAWRKSMIRASSSRPSRLLPLAFSVRMALQPSLRSRASCKAQS